MPRCKCAHDQHHGTLRSCKYAWSTCGTGTHRAAMVGMIQRSPALGISGDIHHSVIGETLAYDEFAVDPMCTNCSCSVPKGYEATGGGLWLHCVRYTGPDWSYSCPHPAWASLR